MKPQTSEDLSALGSYNILVIVDMYVLLLALNNNSNSTHTQLIKDWNVVMVHNYTQTTGNVLRFFAEPILNYISIPVHQVIGAASGDAHHGCSKGSNSVALQVLAYFWLAGFETTWKNKTDAYRRQGGSPHPVWFKLCRHALQFGEHD